MDRRTWMLRGIGVLIVLGLAILWFTNQPRVRLVEINGRRTWIVRAEGDTVTLPGEVRPYDALVCVLDGPDARVRALIDLWIKPGADPTGKIWIEGERIENPPEGGWRTLFDRDPVGPVYVTCGVEHRF